MATLIGNKEALRNFEVITTYEAGIELFGFEVKALKGRQGNLKGAHVRVRGGEAFLVGAHIPPYQPGNTPKEYDPYRSRKLLLNRSELAEMMQYESQKGLTMVPLSVYNKERYVKVEVAVVRGLKKYDKREKMKEKDTKRDIQRSLKTSFR